MCVCVCVCVWGGGGGVICAELFTCLYPLKVQARPLSSLASRGSSNSSGSSRVVVIIII